VTARPGDRAPVPWRALAAGAGVAGGESAAILVRPGLGEVVAATDVIGPLAIALILLAVILFAPDRVVERAFRLLRWAANRPEPAAPPSTTPPQHATGTGQPENAPAPT
jgi:hypothetical protein